MTQRKRPMRRLADVLSGVASRLGLDDELRFARAMTSWERIVAEHVPAAAGASTLLAIRPPALIVSATSPIVAQELRLRSSDLLPAFAAAPGGERLLELRITVRAAPDAPGRRSGPERPDV